MRRGGVGKKTAQKEMDNSSFYDVTLSEFHRLPKGDARILRDEAMDDKLMPIDYFMFF